MSKIKIGRLSAATLVCVVAVTGMTGCGSNADKASKNISTEAEQFKVQRRIVGVNGVTDKVEFEAEGRCSYETYGKRFELVCKQGPREFRKHTIVLSDNIFVIVTQLAPIDVSEFRTKIILRPTNIIPDLDLVTG